MCYICKEGCDIQRNKKSGSGSMVSCFLKNSVVSASRMVDSVHEVENASLQILKFFLLDVNRQTLWELQGFQLCNRK